MINRFTGEYSFLSNFYPVVGKLSVEHLFQALKSTDPQTQQSILESATAGQAKSMGRSIALRQDWDSTRDLIMFGLLQWKFSIPELRSRLLSTGDNILQEGNYWHDTYWGVCHGCKQHGSHGLIGDNVLGRMLMGIREETRNRELIK